LRPIIFVDKITHGISYERKGRVEKVVKKDSELFKPLVVTTEKYLRSYCDGKQQDDEKAKVALRVLSVYRRILKVEKEREEIKSEWEKLIEGVAELKKLTRSKVKPKQGKDVDKTKSKPSSKI
jgi:hypothetical protein